MKTTPLEDRYIHYCMTERAILKKRLAEITHKQIAENLGISKSHVGRIEKGQAHKKRNKAIKAEIYKAMVMAS